MDTARHPSILLPRLRWLATALLVAAAALLSGGAGANETVAEAGDPPGRVGRIADLQGPVWLWNPEAAEWTAAERNAVLTTGDRVSTDANARAELRVGSTTFRMDGGTELEMARIDDDRIDIRLHDGSTAVRVRNRDLVGEIAVFTGEGRFNFQRVGRYRIDRRDDTSYFSVDSGQGQYEGPRSALPVSPGQRAEFWIDTAGVAQYVMSQPQRDEFASWTGERDRAEDRIVASPYVSPEMTGAEELDRHGVWQQSPDYGALWVPNVVAPGWAPYSAGRWSWVRPWGWTWVDEAPWGFAPFHYGRWVHWGGHWAWAPGHRVVRPVYAPALVAWVGGPHIGFNISIGGPPVGWFPLAPREVWVPSYRHSPIYVRNVNVTHITNVTIIDNAVRRPPNPYDLRYRKFPNAVTVVPSDVVARRQSVRVARMRDDAVLREVVDRPVARNAFVSPVAAPPLPARAAGTAAVVTRPPGRTAPVARAESTPPAARAGNAAPIARSERPERADRPTRPVAAAPLAAAPISRPTPTAPPAFTAPAPGRPAAVDRPLATPPRAAVVVERPQAAPQVERPRAQPRPEAAAPPRPAQPAQPVQAARPMPPMAAPPVVVAPAPPVARPAPEPRRTAPDVREGRQQAEIRSDRQVR